MKISKHARLRLTERTKLKTFEFQTILDKSAFLELGVVQNTRYILFYDARGDDFLVAIIREECVVSVICLWQRMPKDIKSLSTSLAVQKRAEAYFYNRAARDLHPRLQAGLNVYISFENKQNKVIVPEEYVFRVDRLGYELCKQTAVIECFVDDISRILVRELSSTNAQWVACVTLRKLNGQMVKKYSCRIGKIITLLPLYGTSHEVRLHVHSVAEAVKLELGPVAAECSYSPVQIITDLRTQFLRLLKSVDTNYSRSEQLKFKYIIELQNNRLSWSRMFPALSHFELREYVDPRHPS